ncbi:hypothetical protein [Thioclava sp. GXIMD4216]|uniref:hypothetical protein n=1 Tax=Thioclava sp. GXIMD4216 TaxID=3131929 RepID=UPI0030D3F638
MMNNLRRCLNAHGLGDLPYAVVLEVSDTERLHLHGVIDTSDLDAASRAALGDALISAGSEAVGAIGGKRQLDLQDISSADGWADYCLKTASKTARLLEVDKDDLIMINNPMKRVARRFFEGLQRERGVGRVF